MIIGGPQVSKHFKINITKELLLDLISSRFDIPADAKITDLEYIPDRRMYVVYCSGGRFDVVEAQHTPEEGLKHKQ